MARELDKINGFTQKELDDFVQKVFNFTEMFCFVHPEKFYPYQEDFAKAIITDRIAGLANTLTGLFARQSGKSETVANVGAALMVILPKLAQLKDENGYLYPQFPSRWRNGFKVGIFAPSNLQSSTTYKRLRDRITSVHARIFLRGSDFATNDDSSLTIISNSSTYLELGNGSLCLQMSADRQSKIESKTFDLILLDESQDLDAFVVGRSIMPMGASTAATAVATGTPGTTKGYFYNMISTNKIEERDKKREDRKIQPQLHFEYDYKVVQKYNDDYRLYIRKEKKKIGEDSDEFKMAYRLIWLLERGMAVPEELFIELSRTDLEVHPSMQNVPLIAGLDWGKGQDSTVLTVGKPLWEQADGSGRMPVEVIYWWEKQGDDYEAIFAQLKAELSRFSIQTLATDATGVGEPLYDRLYYELPMIQVIPVKFSSQSKDHLYKNFLLMLLERRCTWPGGNRVRSRKYWKMFEQQMTDLQKEYKNQYLTCHHPEDMQNAHDDFPDSLALMLWCIHKEAMPYIEVSDSPNIYKGRDWTDPKRPRANEFSLW